MTDNIEAPEEVTEDASESLDIYSLSDEDLDSALQGDQQAEGEEPQTEEASEDSEEQKEKTSPPEEEEQEQPREKEDSKEPSPEERIAKLQAQLAQQETFIQRRNTELGEARRKYDDAIEIIKSKIDEAYLESPSKGIELQKQLSKLETQREEINSEAETLNAIHQRQVAVAKFVKPGEANIEEMAACLEEDGIDAGFIQQFRANPFAHFDTAGIIQLAKRSSIRAERNKLVQIANALWEENKKLKEKPARLINNISRAAKTKPSINGGSGRSSSAKIETFSNPALLSQTELDEALKAAGIDL